MDLAQVLYRNVHSCPDHNRNVPQSEEQELDSLIQGAHFLV